MSESNQRDVKSQLDAGHAFGTLNEASGRWKMYYEDHSSGLLLLLEYAADSPGVQSIFWDKIGTKSRGNIA
jgi:hypothetical protein